MTASMNKETKFKSTSVRMTVTLVVTTGSVYGPEWTIGALRKQVAEEGLQMLRQKLMSSLIQVVGEPSVGIVCAAEENQS